MYIYIKPRDYTKANNVKKKPKASFEREKNIMRYTNETFQEGNEIKIHTLHSLYFLSLSLFLFDYEFYVAKI